MQNAAAPEKCCIYRSLRIWVVEKSVLASEAVVMVEDGHHLLIDWVELDGATAVNRAMASLFCGEDLPFLSVFDLVDYLFYGRAETAPLVWVVGGLSRKGYSLTASGASLTDALRGIAGEVAETEMRAIRSAYPDPQMLCGFAAHSSRQTAIAHARAELIERFVVLNWWQGRCGGTVWQHERTVQRLVAHGPARFALRPPLIVEIDDAPGAAVVFVASFDTLGRDFCFGSACRQDPETAAMAAGYELAQAEMGLYLARMKRHQFGDAGLSAADRTTLTMADKVDRDSLLSSRLTALQADREKTLRLPADSIIAHDVGLIANWLYVVRASASAPQMTGASLPTAPFANVNLY